MSGIKDVLKKYSEGESGGKAKVIPAVLILAVIIAVAVGVAVARSGTAGEEEALDTEYASSGTLNSAENEASDGQTETDTSSGNNAEAEASDGQTETSTSSSGDNAEAEASDGQTETGTSSGDNVEAEASDGETETGTSSGDNAEAEVSGGQTETGTSSGENAEVEASDGQTETGTSSGENAEVEASDGQTETGTSSGNNTETEASGGQTEESTAASSGSSTGTQTGATEALPEVQKTSSLTLSSVYTSSILNPDCGGEYAEEIASLEVTNSSDSYLVKATLTGTMSDGTEVHFVISDLPAGATAEIFDTGNQTLSPKVTCTSLVCTSEEYISGDMVLSDMIAVTASGSSVVLTNIGGGTLTGLTVVYHCDMAGQYFGGTSYTITIDSLAAGESCTLSDSTLMGEVAVVRIYQ